MQSTTYELCQKSMSKQIQNDNEDKVLVNINAFIEGLGDLNDNNQVKEGEKKLNSIDFIQVATNELRKMLSIMCKEVLEIPLFILDFVLEATNCIRQQPDHADALL